jgi:hypothetical protein
VISGPAMAAAGSDGPFNEPRPESPQFGLTDARKPDLYCRLPYTDDQLLVCRLPAGEPSGPHNVSTPEWRSLMSRPYSRRNSMSPHLAEESSSTGMIDRNSFVIMGSSMPPRDPDEDEDENEDQEDSSDEPPVIREPDED